MKTDPLSTCYIELLGGRRVEVGMIIFEEPLFPTPNEPDVVRAPALHEWAEICVKLNAMFVNFQRPPLH